MKRINAIYARQSVDRADSISIESQIEFCKYELKGGAFREYKDKGYSGKNTVRPQLQKIYREIEEIEEEISMFVDSLTGAGETLAAYINQRVEELDHTRQLKMEALTVLAENHVMPEQIEKVISNISLWDQIGFEEKRFTVDKMITLLKVLPGSIQIQWKF